MGGQYSSDAGNVADHFPMLAGKISMYLKSLGGSHFSLAVQLLYVFCTLIFFVEKCLVFCCVKILNVFA